METAITRANRASRYLAHLPNTASLLSIVILSLARAAAKLQARFYRDSLIIVQGGRTTRATRVSSEWILLFSNMCICPRSSVAGPQKATRLQCRVPYAATGDLGAAAHDQGALSPVRSMCLVSAQLNSMCCKRATQSHHRRHLVFLATTHDYMFAALRFEGLKHGRLVGSPAQHRVTLPQSWRGVSRVRCNANHTVIVSRSVAGIMIRTASKDRELPH